MSRNLESERQYTPLVNPGQNESKIPHGVSPKTHGFLIAAQTYNAFADIDPATRNSIAIYYGTDVSLRELPNYIGTKSNKTTVRNGILKGLDTAWEQLPLQVQLQFPKKQVIKLKDSYVSPRFVAKKRENTVTLWKDKSYRQRIVESIQRRRHDPNFIQRMREVSKGRPSPMKGKNRTLATPEIIEKLKSSGQKYWDKRHGIPTNDPLAKRTELVAEWQRLFILLGHFPSSWEITKLQKEGKTKFSITMYKRDFGQGSFTRAREVLDRITTQAGPTLEGAQKLIGFLNSKSQQLRQYGISEDEINKHSAQIKDAYDRIIATSDEKVNQMIETLKLRLIRIERKISIMTPFSINP